VLRSRKLGNDIESSLRPKPELRALVSISFHGRSLPDDQEFVRWLTHLYPAEISGVQVQHIELEASHDSNSTLMLISMPISLWAMLPEAPGCSIVGFVKSGNNLLRRDHEVPNLALDGDSCSRENNSQATLAGSDYKDSNAESDLADGRSAL
jgi:hypothetical protein